VLKSRRSRKLQFSDRQLQISDRGNYRWSKLPFCPYSPQNRGFSPKFGIFGQIFGQEENFQTFFRQRKFPTPATTAQNSPIERHEALGVLMKLVIVTGVLRECSATGVL